MPDTAPTQEQPFMEFLEREYGPALVALFYFTETEQFALGSGSLIKIGTHHFIFTADHVLSDLVKDPDHVYVQFGFRTGQATLTKLSIRNIIRTPEEARRKIDVGAIEIDSFPRDVRWLGLADIALDYVPKDYLFVGLPSQTIEERSRLLIPGGVINVSLMATFFACMHGVFNGDPSRIRGDLGVGTLDYSAHHHVLLSDEKLAEPPVERPFPMGGVSGSAIFKFDMEERPENAFAIKRLSLRLVGIQHQFCYGSYVMGSKVGFLLYLIYRQYGELEGPLNFYFEADGIIQMHYAWRP